MELLPWEPEKVLLDPASRVMIDPEQNGTFTLHARTFLRLIAIRNLSRRIISECCSEKWQPAAK